VEPYEQWHPSDDEDNQELKTMGLIDFQLQYILLGAFCSYALLVYLGELLISPDHFYIKNYKLGFCGLLGKISK